MSVPSPPFKTDASHGMPLFALGFRPFYLLAAVFAAAAIVLWLAVYSGVVGFAGSQSGIVWHRHEMIFGFAGAVIAGFLLTAVRNWTGRPTPVGARLAALAGLWLSGRILMFTGPSWLAAVVDAAFLPVLALTIAIPVSRSASKRNVKIVFVLAGLASANGVYHLSAYGVLPDDMMTVATVAALDIITILIAIMGGRVIPAFTSSAVPEANPRIVPLVEFVALGTLLLILAAGISDVWWPLPDAAWIALLSAAAIAHLVRLLLWDPRRTLGLPLLWMLPVAYAWLPVSLGLRALGIAGLIPASAAVHALTLGAMSGLMMAMMMRSALGHTGRALNAGIIEIAAFILVQVAALVRVSAAFGDHTHYRALVIASGLMWAFAFVTFLTRYGPWLCRRRTDGLPG